MTHFKSRKILLKVQLYVIKILEYNLGYFYPIRPFNGSRSKQGCLVTKKCIILQHRNAYDEYVRDVIIEDRVLIRVDSKGDNFSLVPAVPRTVTVTSRELVHTY